MKTGAMTVLFREQLGTDKQLSHVESLTRLKKAGFEAADVNLCLLAAHKSGILHTDNWKSEAEEIALTAEKLGIDMMQCHLPFKSKKVKWKTPEELEYYYEMVYRAIDIASFLGIPWGVIHPEAFRNAELTIAQKVVKNHETNDSFIEYALKKNLGIAYENMLNKTDDRTADYCSYAEDLVELIDSYKDPRIGACWDTGHANTRYADQWEPLHLVGSRLKCTHVDDNRGKDDLHLLPYQGTVKWDVVMSALRDIGYDRAFSLEVFANNYSPLELKDEIGRHAFELTRYLVNSK